MTTSEHEGGVMKTFKNVGIIDICLLILYVILAAVVYTFLHRLVGGIVSDEIQLDGHAVFITAFSLLLYIMGITSLFRCGLVPYLYYKKPEEHSTHSLEYYVRFIAIVFFLLTISLLLTSAERFFGDYRLRRVGNVLFYITAIVVIADRIWEILVSWEG